MDGSQAALPTIHKSIYWICVLALFTGALANSLRAGTAGALKSAMLDPLDAQHFGEMIGSVLGNSFLGFALKGHVNQVHISENDRGTPSNGHAKIREAISALQAAGTKAERR